MSADAEHADKASSNFNIDDLDAVIHGRVRLGVMACLAAGERIDFTRLNTRLGTTDGTLSVHLRKLEEAGYVQVEKAYNGRRPVTRISISPAGRRAFKKYLSVIEQLLG